MLTTRFCLRLLIDDKASAMTLQTVGRGLGRHPGEVRGDNIGCVGRQIDVFGVGAVLLGAVFAHFPLVEQPRSAVPRPETPCASRVR